MRAIRDFSAEFSVCQRPSVANAGIPPQMQAEFESDGDGGSRTVMRVMADAADRSAVSFHPLPAAPVRLHRRSAAGGVDHHPTFRPAASRLTGVAMTVRSRFALLAAIPAAAFALACASFAPPAWSQTLRAVMNSDLKIVDPIWTTAYITRNHGYMIYDTLFATDANGNVQPQMVDRYTVSPDGLTYTMTLRDGLLWHDGKPVTSEDCIASIRRWGARDATGQKMMSFVKDIQAVDAKTFRILLTSPTGLVLSGLGKPSSA
ncbi:MAG TPA: ABC transporter substrate-binding protein, partial [Casimicrobiaceae bacterium]